jgi:predicted dehydrogenase
LKIGIVGTGNIYKNAHAKAWEALSDVVVVAACDIDERAAREAAELQGAPKVYTDYHDMLASELLEAIDICTSKSQSSARSGLACILRARCL